MKQKQWDEWIRAGDLPTGATYWAVDHYKSGLVCKFSWDGGTFDKRLLSRGLIFRTKTQALACAKRMLAAAKEASDGVQV